MEIEEGTVTRSTANCTILEAERTHTLTQTTGRPPSNRAALSQVAQARTSLTQISRSNSDWTRAPGLGFRFAIGARKPTSSLLPDRAPLLPHAAASCRYFYLSGGCCRHTCHQPPALLTRSLRHRPVISGEALPCLLVHVC